MKFFSATFFYACLLSSTLPGQENPQKGGTARNRERGGAIPVIVPAGTKAKAQSQPPLQLGNSRSNPPTTTSSRDEPRIISTRANPLFLTDRIIADIDGIPVRTSELNQLVAYYQTFRPGSEGVLLRDAFNALVPLKAMQAACSPDLAAMETRCREAMEKLQGKGKFEDVVAHYSDDSEAPTADGRYTFGREVAGQPFDRLAHSGPIHQLHGPFLTKYGYHLLQVVGYKQGEQPKEDKTEVRHVLIMFPALKALPESEVRPWIAEKVATCSIRLLEPGFFGMVPPGLRANLVAD